MSARRLLILGVPLALAFALAACPNRPQTAAGACAVDSDCGPEDAWRCEERTGACYCELDSACPTAQFCNNAGFCQDRSGCEKNADCVDPLLFCETSTGQCLSRGRCSADIHCSLGQVCDFTSSRCVDGCRNNGDCKDVSCRCGTEACDCNPADDRARVNCPIGVCDPNWCADEKFCRYGEFCSGADSGTPHQCYSDFSRDRPYCSSCTTGGGIVTCGNGANYCLVNTRGGSSYCGADCSQPGQDCPRGYACEDVVVVSGNRCTPQAPACPVAPSVPCTEDANCPRGGVCGKLPDAGSGFCAGRCSLGEGDTQGFCTCLVNSDCQQDVCQGGVCSISKRSCAGGAGCPPIFCVDFNGVGGCFIGRNCAPQGGLTCGELAP